MRFEGNCTHYTKSPASVRLSQKFSICPFLIRSSDVNVEQGHSRGTNLTGTNKNQKSFPSKIKANISNFFLNLISAFRQTGKTNN